MKIHHQSLFILFFSLFIVTGEANAATKSTAILPVNQVETEKRVREFFKDTPVMIEIARCESNFRQFTDAGNVLRGGDSGGMVGVFQFFESIHANPAKALGFDIATLEGNLDYATHVYTQQGTVPWNPAKYCWETKPVTNSVKVAQLKAQIATLTKLITLLQKQLLNKQALALK